MLTGFRDFLMRGNVVDLAVGIVIGAAFGTVVTALVKDLLTPLIAAIFTTPDFSKMILSINGSGIMYGDFLNALISFLIAAASIYFFVVMPMNKVMAKKPEAPVVSGPTPDQKLLMEIRDALLKRP